MPLQSSGPIKMSEIKDFLGSSSNSLRDYSAAAKAATGDAKFDTPDSLGEFYSYAGATTTTTLPPITFTSIGVSCIMYEGSGRIEITVSGGSGQYQYSIDNGLNFTLTTTETTRTFDNLNNGSYIIKVKSVTDNIIYTYNSGNPIGINCFPVLGGSFTNSCDSNGIGTIFITATGGSGNYIYKITRTSDNTDTTSTFGELTGLDSFGTYNVYIIDAPYSNEIYIGQVTFNCTTTTTTTTAAPFQSWLAERNDGGAYKYVGPYSNWSGTFGIGSSVEVNDGSGICWTLQSEATAGIEFTITGGCSTTTTTTAAPTTTTTTSGRTTTTTTEGPIQ
jgi:hypothetical protein